MTTPRTRALDRALEAMALGRIALGLGSLAAPAAMARCFGIRATPEVAYLTRIYGGRAVALGLSYLLADDGGRQRLQRISLGVDLSDTATGLAHLARRDAPLRAMACLVALTGGYAAIGSARAASDVTARKGRATAV